MVLMKLRRPYSTASIWASGKITCTGTQSEADARKGARRCARAIQKLGFNVQFKNFQIVNVLGTCNLPFGILIHPFAAAHREQVRYALASRTSARIGTNELLALKSSSSVV